MKTRRAWFALVVLLAVNGTARAFHRHGELDR